MEKYVRFFSNIEFQSSTIKSYFLAELSSLNFSRFVDKLDISKMGCRVVQVTNIAPSATESNMREVFGIIGDYSDLKLYPSTKE